VGNARLGPVDAVVFDLGGVLVRLTGLDELTRLSGHSREEIVRRWLGCRWVRRFESGRCPPDEFAAGVVADWGLPLSADAFLDSFVTWPEALFDGAVEIVTETAGVATVACLSNTNALHWEVHARRWELDALFDELFLSHLMGMVKPDAAVFDHVVDVLGRPAPRILLLDDSPPNVEAARNAGLRAKVVRGPVEARRVLAELGVLDDSRTFSDDDGAPRGDGPGPGRPPTGREQAGGD